MTFTATTTTQTQKQINHRSPQKAFLLTAQSVANQLLTSQSLTRTHHAHGTDASKPYLETAPWLIAIFAQRQGGVRAGIQRQNYYVTESVGIATGFLIAALHHAGLATLTHTPKPMNFLNGICERPDTERPHRRLVVGYPATDATVPGHATIKKPLTEIARFI